MSCFKGGCKPNSKSRDGYDKFVSEEDEQSSASPPRVIQLKASAGERKKRSRCPSVQLHLVVKKFKGACSKVVAIAKKSGSSYFTDLFTNNQLLVHLSASPQSTRKRKLYPTVGFTNITNNNNNNNNNAITTTNFQSSQEQLD